MAQLAKFLSSTAGVASGSGGGLDIDECFSCHLYDGNGSTQTITNGIDLSGEGGLVWAKCRNIGYENMLTDTARGTSGGYLQSDNTSAQATGGASPALTAFNSNGFTLGTRGEINNGSGEFVSWTFRKSPMFDIVTYTGNATARTISHSLGSVPGMIIVKQTSGTKEWRVYHRGMDSSAPEDYYLVLNSTATRVDNADTWNDTAPTSTVFSVGSGSVTNQSGQTYVAYLFAHHANDGSATGFGPDGDSPVISCGSFTTDGSSDATIDLGFEPQWVLFKRTDSSTSGAWNIFDSMRGMQGDFISQGAVLEANKADAEQTGKNLIAVTPTGFKIDNYGANRDFIYMAIAHSICASSEPTSASDVFAIDTGTGTSTPMFTSNFPVDMAINRIVDSLADTNIVSRLTGKQRLKTNSTEAESLSNPSEFDFMDGFYDGTLNLPTFYSWMWKRAPSYFDCLCYSGTGSNLTLDHNLSAIPEMVWIKRRNGTGSWLVWHKAYQTTQALFLNESQALISNQTGNLQSTPSSTQFTVGTYGGVNNSSGSYIAMLFATVSNVSKVGSYISNGAQQNIDCGFSGSGARYVLVKRTDGTGHWITFDAARGITSNTDPHLRLNDTSAEDTDGNIDIEPYSSGFTVNYGSNNLNNNTGQTYIFYAIAA